MNIDEKFSWQKKLMLKNRSSYQVLKSLVGFERSWADAVAENLTRSLGTVWFLSTSIIFILGWVLLNLGVLPGVVPFDPYPYSFLMMIVQFFVIFLSVIVLISQNRQARISEVRQRMDLEINVRAEHEITKILRMIDELHSEHGIAKDDQELEQMMKKIDISAIQKEVEFVIESEKKISGV